MNDIILEIDETLSLELSSSETFTILGPIVNTTVVIVDDDGIITHELYSRSFSLDLCLSYLLHMTLLLFLHIQW